MVESGKFGVRRDAKVWVDAADKTMFNITVVLEWMRLVVRDRYSNLAKLYKTYKI